MLEKLTLKKTIRMILFLVPLAVLASVSYTLWSSGDANLSALLDISVPWLLAAVFLSLAPWIVAAIRLGLWARFFHLPMSTRDIFEIVLANDVEIAERQGKRGGEFGNGRFPRVILHNILLLIKKGKLQMTLPLHLNRPQFQPLPANRLPPLPPAKRSPDEVVFVQNCVADCVLIISHR